MLICPSFISCLLFHQRDCLTQCDSLMNSQTCIISNIIGYFTFNSRWTSLESIRLELWKTLHQIWLWKRWRVAFEIQDWPQLYRSSQFGLKQIRSSRRSCVESLASLTLRLGWHSRQQLGKKKLCPRSRQQLLSMSKILVVLGPICELSRRWKSNKRETNTGTTYLLWTWKVTGKTSLMSKVVIIGN